MIAGMVCLLRYFGELACFSAVDESRGTIGRPISDEIVLSTAEGSAVDEDDEFWLEVRSSHLPRTRSTLLATRWVDVHLLGVVDIVEEPVVLVSRLNDDDWELVLANELGPLRDEVRSSKRVWYAKGAGGRAPLDGMEDKDSVRSISVWIADESLPVLPVDPRAPVILRSRVFNHKFNIFNF